MMRLVASVLHAWCIVMNQILITFGIKQPRPIPCFYHKNTEYQMAMIDTQKLMTLKQNQERRIQHSLRKTMVLKPHWSKQPEFSNTERRKLFPTGGGGTLFRTTVLGRNLRDPLPLWIFIFVLNVSGSLDAICSNIICSKYQGKQGQTFDISFTEGTNREFSSFNWRDEAHLHLTTFLIGGLSPCPQPPHPLSTPLTKTLFPNVL